MEKHIQRGGGDGSIRSGSQPLGRPTEPPPGRSTTEPQRLYRVFSIRQALVMFGLLAAYIRRLPSREVYRIEGPLAFLMHAIQAGAVVYATAAAGRVGLRRVTGLERLLGRLGESPVPPEPESQGPALDDEGRHHAPGPLAWSRHPLNLEPGTGFCSYKAVPGMP